MPCKVNASILHERFLVRLLTVCFVVASTLLLVPEAHASYMLVAQGQVDQFASPNTQSYTGSANPGPEVSVVGGFLDSGSTSYSAAAAPGGLIAESTAWDSGIAEVSSSASLTGAEVIFDNNAAYRSLFASGASSVTFDLEYEVEVGAFVDDDPRIPTQAAAGLNVSVSTNAGSVSGSLTIQNDSNAYLFTADGVMSQFNQFGGAAYFLVPFTVSEATPAASIDTSVGSYTLSLYYEDSDVVEMTGPIGVFLGDVPVESLGLSDSFNPQAPEPASLTLLGLGALGLTGYGLRRRK